MRQLTAEPAVRKPRGLQRSRFWTELEETSKGGPVPQPASFPRLDASPQIARPWSWTDYGLIDSGRGRKLERYGEVHVVRPEPQCWWEPRLDVATWERADATFDPSGDEDAGRWRTQGQTPEQWTMAWRDLRFAARLTPFRHLAFFPEQEPNWAFIDRRVRARTGMRVLNLFGYTGVASLAAAAAGAEVTHLDGSKKSIGWAKENAALSALSAHPIRWICEDARRFVQREIRRGSRYDGVVLDPPKYGRGPAGEVWRLFEDLPELLGLCAELLSPQADFLLLNAYAARISGLSLAHLAREALADRGGELAWGELALSEEPAERSDNEALDRTGLQPREVGLSFFARWTAEAAK